MDTKQFLKMLIRNHHQRGLSIQDTIDMLTNDNFAPLLLSVAADYPSVEACVNVLTAEALLEEEFIDLT